MVFEIPSKAQISIWILVHQVSSKETPGPNEYRLDEVVPIHKVQSSLRRDVTGAATVWE